MQGPPEAVEVVRWLFHTYAETLTSTAKLATLLDERGIKPPRTRRWRATSIRNILQNRLYIGELQWNERHVGMFFRLAAGRPEPDEQQCQREQQRRQKDLKDLPAVTNADADVIHFYDPALAIIEPELFRLVQARLKAHRTRTSPAHVQTWELAGLLVCGHCGEPVWGQPIKGKRRGETYRYQRVTCSMKRDQGAATCPDSGGANLEEILKRVIAHLQEKLGNTAAINQLRADLAEAAQERAIDVEAKRRTLGKRLDDLDSEIATASKRLLLLPDDVQADALAQYRLLKEEHEKLCACLKELEDEELRADTARSSRLDRALALVGELHKLLGQCREKLRDALHELIKRVELHFVPIGPDEPRSRYRGRATVKLHHLDITLSDSFADLLTMAGRDPENR